MKHFSLLRLARRLDRFNCALLAALAAMALTACGNGPQPAAASSSLASGVQQILHASESSTAAARSGERVARSPTTSYQTNEEHP
ncbi:hypothetical protein [Ramlibacter sp. WS9]|uniref:hypothetical protein n=1 Tax=Ramlibacter sp. WS9 TaxID=1882741 RepID=UPI001143160E|nr:hypothetical protein [Ramlibacter sp. WS9]ROZ66733.1 hypothetical protein EEB15_25715 [Ramlibacter sp. WS9]